MSLTKQERENLLKTIEIASGGEISTNEANQMTGRLVDVDQLIYIAEQCYKEGVRSSLFRRPLQYKLIDILKANYEVLSEQEPIRIRDIRVVFEEMMREISCNFGKNDPFNPRVDSQIRLLLTMLLDMVDIRIDEGYELIKSTWGKIFASDDLGLSVSTDIFIYSGYARIMVVLKNDSVQKGQLICEEDFKNIVEYLISLYRELHNENIISRLDELSVDDLVWEDYKTYVKCIEGDNSPLTRAYMEEAIVILEREHITEMMDTQGKINCLKNCIDNYYNMPLAGFDSDIENITNH